MKFPEEPGEETAVGDAEGSEEPQETDEHGSSAGEDEDLGSLMGSQYSSSIDVDEYDESADSLSSSELGPPPPYSLFAPTNQTPPPPYSWANFGSPTRTPPGTPEQTRRRAHSEGKLATPKWSVLTARTTSPRASTENIPASFEYVSQPVLSEVESQVLPYMLHRQAVWREAQP